MGASRNISAYSDVDAVLRAALAQPEGAAYHAANPLGVHTPGAGLNWLQRARFYLRLLRERAERLDPASMGAIPYDELRLTRACGCRGRCQRADPLECTGHIIEIRRQTAIRGELFALDGTPLVATPAPPPTLEVDPLLRAALKAREELGLRGEVEE